MSFLSDLLGSAYKEGMTEEEISQALESASTSKTDEITKLKTSLSKANSEAADYKKQLRAKQSDEEAKAQEQKDAMDKLEKENAELKRSMALAERKGKLIGMGYDAKLADETAVAMVDGDLDTVLANQSKFLETQIKAIKASKMEDTPRPAVGANGSDGGSAYADKIKEAQASGDMTALAYYTRLMAQETNESTN